VLAQLSLNKGDLIVLGGMVFWAAYTIFLRMKPAELPVSPCSPAAAWSA
jgi:drug/metabolite transporter (DMT)-like permease